MSTPYGSSAVFDEKSVPDALRKDHRTKPGTWGLLRVLEGEVRLVFNDARGPLLVTVDRPAMIPPEALHHVECDKPMRMLVEFYCEPPVIATDAVNG